MKLLIAGSRQVTPAMINYTRRAVRRANQLGWEILVGDAFGIDAAVIAESDRLGMTITVFGIASKPRNMTTTGTYVHVPIPPGTAKAQYLFRDQHMIMQADITLFIWNGISQGTKAGYEFALSKGITAHLVRPQASKSPMEQTGANRAQHDDIY